MNDITIRFIEVYTYLLEQKKVSNPSHFAKMIEISTSLINEILKGRSNAGINPIQNTVKIFNEINAEWLLTGKGNRLKKENESFLTVNEPIPEYDKESKLIEFLKNQISDKNEIIAGLKRENQLLWKLVDGDHNENGKKHIV